MASKKTAEAPPVMENLKLTDLTIEEGFNVRDEAQFKKNVKELSAQIEAAGGIDPTKHHVTYVLRGDKRLVRDGHTLYASAEALGIKEVPAMKANMTRVQELANLVLSNAGHPLSQIEQGRVYIRMKEGDDPAKVETGQEVLAAMSTKEIADEIGCSTVHIENCLAIAEATPEIRELLEAGQISANAFVKAKNNVKNKDTVLKILRAAIRKAKELGKECATPQHVAMVKEDFVAKKQTAVSTKASDATTPSTAPGATGEAQPAPGATDAAAGGTTAQDHATAGTGKKKKDAPHAPANAGDLGEPGEAQPAPGATDAAAGGTTAQHSPELPMPASHGDTVKLFMAVIDDFCKETSTAMSDEEIAQLAERLVTAQTEKNVPI